MVFSFIERHEKGLIVFYSDNMDLSILQEVQDLKIPVLPVIATSKICTTFQFVKVPRYEFWYKGNNIKTIIGKRNKKQLQQMIKDCYEKKSSF